MPRINGTIIKVSNEYSYKSIILFILGQTSEIKIYNFLAKQKFISFLKYIYYTVYIGMYIGISFSATLDELEKEKNNKKRWRNWKI